jgi:hypothetical protein
MIPNERRYLGPVSAERDERFEDHFVASIDLTRLLRPQSDVVYGSKGVGKTALRRALTELHCDQFYTTKTVNLKRLSFAQVHKALEDLGKASSTELPNLARNMWQNVLALYGLEAIGASLPSNHPTKTKIETLFKSLDDTDEDPSSRLVGYIDRLLLRFGQVGLENGSRTALSVPIKSMSLLSEFPSDPRVKGLLTECSALVTPTGKVVLLCLDGFDSIVDRTAAARTAIFAGLIDAIFETIQDPELSSMFAYKAFLPQELTRAAHVMVWEADKYLGHAHYLRWSEDDFGAFLRKRLIRYAKTRSSGFLDVWHDFMPEKIRNDQHRFDEASFNYILRHTLYRPRQVLIHVQEILDLWDARSDKFRVDPSFVPTVVASMNQTLAQMVVNQLELDHPGLNAFMKSWRGRKNTVTVGEFQDRIRKIFGISDTLESLEFFDTLFNFGIFGVAERRDLSLTTQQARFRFDYVGDGVTPGVHFSLDDKDVVAFSPMFHEFCGCIPSEFGAIIPVAA